MSDLLNYFSGSDVNFTTWSEKVSLIQESHNLSDSALKCNIISKLKGRALSWFHAKSEHVTLDCTQLLQRMKIMFDQRPNKLSLRQDFEKRKWNTGELFGDYHHDKIILAYRVPVPEDEILDYVIDGISDPGLRNQARMLRRRSTDELLEAFEKIFLLSQSHNDQGKSDKPKSKTKPPDEKQQQTNTSGPQRGLIRCYNCDKIGHAS